MVPLRDKHIRVIFNDEIKIKKIRKKIPGFETRRRERKVRIRLRMNV